MADRDHKRILVWNVDYEEDMMTWRMGSDVKFRPRQFYNVNAALSWVNRQDDSSDYNILDTRSGKEYVSKEEQLVRSTNLSVSERVTRRF